MKAWKNPEVLQLGVEMTAGVGNEIYTDPAHKPEQHPYWVWCTEHGQWHPKNHS